MVGVGGTGLAVTVIPNEEADEQPPDVMATVQVPEFETVIDCVVAPVDHRFPLVDEEVNTTEPPEQNAIGPPTEMVGVGGTELTVTEVADADADAQPAVVTETV